jgi:enoyl-CoA hydratase/carnithine racemase
MIDIDYRDSIAIVKLNRGITNALNLEFVQSLAEVLQEMKSDPEVHALVLSSSNEKFFSIGFDIPQLFGLTRDDFRVFYRTINQMYMDLFSMPKPIVAAIGGHAIAGGCILTLCCDYRLIAKGRKLMGLNEIKLGVPVPYIADCVLRYLIGVRTAREILELGEFYQSDELLELGLVDEVCPLGEVLPKSVEKAKVLGSKPHEAYGMIKRNRIEAVEREVLANWEEKAERFMDLWYSAEARGMLREAMEKF